MGDASGIDRELPGRDGDVPTVFISYSGRDPADKRFVYRLIQRLDDHPVRVWIYGARGSEIPPGRGIVEYCNERIDECDLFVSVINEAAFGSHVTRKEVRHALARQNQSKDGQPTIKLFSMIPIVLLTVDPAKPWPEPFDELNNTYRKWCDTDATSNVSIDDRVRDIVSQVGVKYIDPPPEDARFPLLRRLMGEIECAADLVNPDEREYLQQIELWLRADAIRIMEAYRDKNYSHALELLTGICATLNSRYANPEGHALNPAFYYPFLMKAVLQEKVYGDRVTAQLRRETLSQLLTPSGRRTDENLFAAMGAIEIAASDTVPKAEAFTQALGFYLKAAQVAKHIDPDIVFQVLGLKLRLGIPVNKAEYEVLFKSRTFDADTGKSLRPDAPAIRPELLEALRAFADLTSGNEQQAVDTISRLAKTEFPKIDILVAFANRLAERAFQTPAGLHRLEDAINILSALAQNTKGLEQHAILQRKARVLFSMHRDKEAAKIFEQIATQTQTQSLDEHITFLSNQMICEARRERTGLSRLRGSKNRKSHHIAQKIIALTAPQEAVTRLEFNRGAAHYHLRQKEAADASFNRSKTSPQDHYALYFADLGINS